MLTRFASLAACALLTGCATAPAGEPFPTSSADDAMRCSAIMTARAIQMGPADVQRARADRKPEQLFCMSEAWTDEAWRRGGPAGPDHETVVERVDAMIRPLAFGGQLVVDEAVNVCAAKVPARDPRFVRIPAKNC